jgi:hypothetical protein
LQSQGENLNVKNAYIDGEFCGVDEGAIRRVAKAASCFTNQT